MATNVKSIIPAVATHPGSVLKKELKARGIKQKDFAGTIGVPAPNLSELIKGKRNITEAIAIKLEEALGIPYQSWMNLQNPYNYVVKCREEIVSGKNVIPSSGTSVFLTCMKADFIVAASRLILIPMKSMSNVGRGTNSSQANKRDPPFQNEMASVAAFGKAVEETLMKVSHEYLPILLVVMARKGKQPDLA